MSNIKALLIQCILCQKLTLVRSEIITKCPECVLKHDYVDPNILNSLFSNDNNVIEPVSPIYDNNTEIKIENEDENNNNINNNNNIEISSTRWGRLSNIQFKEKINSEIYKIYGDRFYIKEIINSRKRGIGISGTLACSECHVEYNDKNIYTFIDHPIICLNCNRTSKTSGIKRKISDIIHTSTYGRISLEELKDKVANDLNEQYKDKFKYKDLIRNYNGSRYIGVTMTCMDCNQDRTERMFVWERNSVKCNSCTI